MSKVDEIKRQAVRLMAERGFEGVSLRQLAAAAGMGGGSIYAHYPSKAQLLLELCCEHQEDLTRCWLEQRRRKGASAQLLSFIAVYVGFYYARVAQSRIFQLDWRSLDAPGKAVVTRLKARYEDELEAILRQGMLDGSFQISDLRIARLGVLALLQGFCAAACDSGAVSEARTAEMCMTAILRQVGAAPAAVSKVAAAG